MAPSLEKLLNHVFDYAGLFPPAKLLMPNALLEYRKMVDQHEWLVNRFIVPASRLTEAADEAVKLMEGQEGEGKLMEVTVVGTPVEEMIQAGETLAEDLRRIEAEPRLEVTAYEVRFPANAVAIKGGARGLKRLMDRGIDVYVELPWGKGQNDAMCEVAEVEGIGFKARMGGLKADNFPEPFQVASWMNEAVMLDCPFKFTAGLHEPMRYLDEELGIKRHGFLNVLMAAATATHNDISRLEIQQILEIEDEGAFIFNETEAKVLGQSVSLEQIEESLAEGIGSCSITEPVDGLKRIGLLS